MPPGSLSPLTSTCRTRAPLETTVVVGFWVPGQKVVGKNSKTRRRRGPR